MKLLIPIAAGTAACLLLVACGGGGANGTIPPANPPTCSSLDTQTGKSALVSSQGVIAIPGVIVPRSTVENAGDVGQRAHTNYLINTAGRGRGRDISGFTPAQITTVYNVPAGGSGAIAVIDAYDDPTALADFNTFATQFGLPTETSSDPTASTNTVFQVVYVGGSAPAVDASWAQESALDTQWAHAVAPGAKVYLVEAASSLLTDLMAAANLAKTLPGVTQVSMSFGSTEVACDFVHYDTMLLQPGVEFFAPAGDTSAERDYPALSVNVVAVGGTTLTMDSSNHRLAETVWKSSGGNGSHYEPRPTFQDRVSSLIGQYRASNDITAVADPNTGVAVYSGTPYLGFSGWQVFGGTSASCPIIAGIANVAHTGRNGSFELCTQMYSQLGTTAFVDVVTGVTGPYTAGAGWDIPSGVGAPNGITGF